MRTTFLRRLSPFMTYSRSFCRSRAPLKDTSELYPLARGEATFMSLLIRLSECTVGEYYG